MGNGAMAKGPKLPRPSSTLPREKSSAPQRLRQVSGGLLSLRQGWRHGSSRPLADPARRARDSTDGRAGHMPTS